LLVQSLEGIEVVVEASDGREALNLIKAYHPDIVLMDVVMPGLNGLEAVARATKEFPGVRIIMLSMYTNYAQAINHLCCRTVLYRPRALPHPCQWRWVSWGAVVATVLWMIGPWVASSITAIRTRTACLKQASHTGSGINGPASKS
jgi:CheY-like chemotaxis protein